MKKIFLTLTLILSGIFIFANGKDGADSISTITKFTTSNIEVLNMDKYNILFKENHCKDGGYSFFSPYNNKPELIGADVSTTEIDGILEVEIKKSEDILENLKISNFQLSEDKTFVTFDVVKGNQIFPSKLYGTNLSLDFVKDSFKNLNNSTLVSTKACPPCVIVLILAAAKICSDAQNACTPCNGTLIVGNCSCSCTPK